MGKCWRGKFPVKHKSGERFNIVASNTPLYDDDGSLVGLICLSTDTRTLEEILGHSTSGKVYPSSAKPRVQLNGSKSGLLNKVSCDSQQPLQSAITSRITNLVSHTSEQTKELTIIESLFWYFFMIYFVVYTLIFRVTNTGYQGYK